MIGYCAFIAGLSAKLYDDLVDNELLKEYRSEFRLEYLKGIHYILFTIISLHSSFFWMIQMAFNSVYVYFNRNTYELPYEHSLWYLLPILFLFTPKITFDISIPDFIIMIAIVLGASFETMFKKETSIQKMLYRCALIPILIIEIFMSSKTFYFLLYTLGYIICSVCLKNVALNKKYKNLNIYKRVLKYYNLKLSQLYKKFKFNPMYELKNVLITM